MEDKFGVYGQWAGSVVHWEESHVNETFIIMERLRFLN